MDDCHLEKKTKQSEKVILKYIGDSKSKDGTSWWSPVFEFYYIDCMSSLKINRNSLGANVYETE